ncbi:MAG TPA: HAD family hydrolase [Phycisphaerae bacterium]|jgi:phosphoglycolate phosphatase
MTQDQGLRPQDFPRSPGVIFDLDGTLADTLNDITASVNHALAAVGRPPRPRDVIRPMIGEGVRVLLARAAERDDPQLIDRMLPVYRAHYHAHALDQTRLYPGIDEVLNVLVAGGCPLAVLSNKPHDFTVEICRVLLAPWPFVAIDGHREGDARKPDPAAAIALAQRMARRHEVFFVGDSGIDVRTALAAGMTPIGVTWGFRSLDEIQAAGAQLIAHAPSDLPRLILGATIL